MSDKPRDIMTLRDALESRKRALAALGVTPQEFDFNRPPPRHAIAIRVNRPKEPREWVPYFLWGLQNLGTIGAACRYARIPRREYERHRKADAEFAREADDALADFLDGLEQVALAKAAEGDANLLRFILSAKKPEYQTRQEINHRFTQRERAEIVKLALAEGLSSDEADRLAASIEAEYRVNER